MKNFAILAALFAAVFVAGCGDKEAGSDVEIHPATTTDAGPSSNGERAGTPGGPPATPGAHPAGSGSGSGQAGSRSGTGG